VCAATALTSRSAPTARVVDHHRHGHPEVLADHPGGAVEELAAHALQRGQCLRHHGGDHRGSHIAVLVALEPHELGQRRGVLVSRALAHGRDPPLPERLTLAVQREHGIGVADVDRE
jgi:hypothetical protein